MTDQELLDYNAQGFIPGPEESEERFLERIRAATCEIEGSVPRAHWEWVRLHLLELFDFAPQSLSAVYSNVGLAPWQGAACWITPEGAVHLQLREGFRKGSYLGLYSREETLAHEAVHAARAAFVGSEFEEVFAYGASDKRWRQVLGPIVNRPWEVWPFLAFLIGGCFWEKSFAIAALWAGLGFTRLLRRHVCLARASKTLMRRLECARTMRAVLFRLTDGEIGQLARGGYPEGDASLRWRLLRLKGM